MKTLKKVLGFVCLFFVLCGVLLFLSDVSNRVAYIIMLVVFGIPAYLLLFRKDKASALKEDTISVSTKVPKKNLGVISVVLIVIAVVVIVVNLPKHKDETLSEETKPEIETILSAKDYKLISAEELVQRMGNPESTEDWNFSDNKGVHHLITTYSYQNHRFEFDVCDNTVQNITINSDKYNDRNAKSFEFKDKTDILKMIGIDPASIKSASKRIDTNSAIRYYDIDGIRSVWIPSYEDHNFDMIKIQYSDLF